MKKIPWKLMNTQCCRPLTTDGLAHSGIAAPAGWSAAAG
jgi:hypothetical protein